MAITLLNKGTVANDRTGTPLRDGAQIVNDNFAYLNSTQGSGDLVNSALAKDIPVADDLWGYRDSVTGLFKKIAWNTLVAKIKLAMALVKADVGLGNVDNTSDANKPVSTAQGLADAAVLSTANYYADSLAAAVGGAVLLKGTWDASTGAFPATTGRKAGWSYLVSVAGTVSGVAFAVDDLLIAVTDNASSSVYTGNWYQNNTGVVQGVEITANKATGIGSDPTSTIKYPHFAAVYDWVTGGFATIASLASYAQLAANNAWTKAQRVTPVTLTSSAANIAIDLNDSNSFSHTATENTTLANPSNAIEGQSGNIKFIQHASTAKTLAFAANWKKATGSAAAVPTTLSARCSIEYRVLASDYIIYSIVTESGVA